MMNSVFLKAEWRKLILANYSVTPDLLMPYLPAKTELDFWQGTCYVSLVGFMFEDTKVKGLSIPFHRRFEEVNLRFYVKYYCPEEKKIRRGVVFIQEIVPKPMITLVANLLYHEKYTTMKMKHEWLYDERHLTVKYSWRKKNQWHHFEVQAQKNPVALPENSEAEFITEHFWGYTKISDRKTSEYGVEHPRWQIYPTERYDIQVNFNEVYGRDFAFLTETRPKSVFMAEGSEISVKSGTVL